MQTRATLKFGAISPSKLALVAKLARGKKVEQALHILRFTPQRGAKILTKVIRSAVANADQKGTIDVDTLFVKEIKIGGGPIYWRITPRARGSATWIRKR